MKTIREAKVLRRGRKGFPPPRPEGCQQRQSKARAKSWRVTVTYRKISPMSHESSPRAGKESSSHNPTAPAPGEDNLELQIEGFQGTPQEIERQWLEKVYRGRGDTMAQLTLRAVIMGSILGGILSLTNLYIGLKSGWGFGVAITACILSYAIWSGLYGIGLAKTKMTILENNCMQSTASAAGYSTGTTLISAFAAFILITGQPLPLGQTMAWVFFLAVLGVTMAIPMKRQMVNIEQLRFPSGIAAAETLRALHSHGEKGMRAAKALGLAGGLAALSQFLTDGLRLVWAGLEPYQIGSLVDKVNGAVLGSSWIGRTVAFNWDPIFIAAGTITGMRVCLSTIISGTLCWAVYVPLIQHHGSTLMFSTIDFKDDKGRSVFVDKLRAKADPLASYLWSQLLPAATQALQDPGVPQDRRAPILAQALDGILLGPSIYDATRFANVQLSPETSRLLASHPEGIDQVRLNRLLLEDAYPNEVAKSTGFRALVQWTLWAGTACMVTSGVLNFLFQWRTSLRAFRNLGKLFQRGRQGADPLDALEAPTSWFLVGQIVSLAVLAYLGKMSFGMPYWLAAFALVLSFLLALVACRVTGETDTTPVGPMGQLTQLIVGGIHPGSATTNVMSANVVSSAAISSADLLTDLKSGYLLGANPRKQFLAQFSGIFVGTLVSVLAFSVMVPNASVLGTDQFPAPAAQRWQAVTIAMSHGIGDLHPIKKWSIAIGGTVGVVLALLPLLFPNRQKYIPSAAGVGLAWTFHWYYSMLFFLGALVGYVWTKRAPKNAEEFTYPVASGVIAGGSLMGVLLIFWESGPKLFKDLIGHWFK
jgi:uncharacterized oligopeptide transporter (OPT) family protein